MARFHPPRPNEGATEGERAVFRRLGKLNDSWVVLHSLHFAWSARDGARLGESDFVLLHPHRGMLVLEVKDARYRVEARTWYRLPTSGSEVADRQSPFEQAERNRHKITDILREAGVRRVPIGHCVVFKAGIPSGPLGPDAPSAIVLNMVDLDDAPTAIDQVVRHWAIGSWASETDYAKAIEVLSPEAQIAPSLGYDVDVALGELHRLTDRQIHLTTRQLDVVRATSQNAASLVLGAAGTGKTFVAYEYARQMAAKNQAVAVVGTPKQLRLVTRRAMAEHGVVVGDVFDLLHSVYSDDEREPLSNLTAWEQAIELAYRHGCRIDVLIVDEAQSMDDDVLAVLGELVRSDGQIVLLADPYQRDSSGMWRPTGKFNEQWLTENCRNSLPVAKLVSRISGAQTPLEGAAGRTPLFTPVNTAEVTDAAALVAPELQELGASKAVVITRTVRAANRLLDGLRRAGLPVARSVRDGVIPICTVDEFRGCEAHAAVYFAERVQGLEDVRTLDYLATSRACAYLHVVGAADDWRAYDFLLEPRTLR